MSHDFYFVDVFAEQPFTGNPVTVVPDADDLSEVEMRAIAREFNQSETTFVLKPSSAAAAWRLRSFTPAGVEVGGAGHNALGAWVLLEELGLVEAGSSTRAVTQIGEELLPVEVVRDPHLAPRVVMDQGQAVIGPGVAAVAELAASLGLGADDLTDPPRVLSTGVAHLHVPVVSREAVDAVVVETGRLREQLAQAGAEGCYVYTLAGSITGEAAYARFFNPTVGIVEDPATGTAAGPLAAALVEWGLAPGAEPVFIEQGHRLGRPSRIRVDVTPERVRISGAGVISASGRLVDCNRSRT